MTKSSAARTALIAVLAALSSSICIADVPWPSFTATTLSGDRVESERLLGQSTILIVTPSRDAAQSTRTWVNALRKRIDTKRLFLREVLAVDLPFFMSERDAIGRAKEAIPRRYHDQTWILNAAYLENGLGIPPDSTDACIVVLNDKGQIIATVHGDLTDARMSAVTDAVAKLGQ